jgi:glycosyltransferase involved in cell wall biosynthesis
MSNKFDILMTTRNRLEYSQRAIECIFERTRTPYRLHVVDDNSTDGTVDYLLKLWKEGRICDLLLRGIRSGNMANKNVINWMGFSDPFVITSDDLLCPDVEPDWLQRGIEAIMGRCNGEDALGELDLNHPGAYRIRYKDDGVVAYCRAVGGTFGFIRRTMVPHINLAHFRKNFGVTDDIQRSNLIQQAGFKVGYLIETFCYHYGNNSSLSEGQYGNSPFIEPTDWKTLRPPEEFVWM